jgi:hypothetical protein
MWIEAERCPMPTPPPDISSLCGSYSGSGSWVDEAGESKPYRVRQSISRSEQGVIVDYTHEFYEEGSTTSGAFVLQPHGTNLLQVFMNGKQMGHGYAFAGYLHYYLKVGEIFVQVSYQASATGLDVHGSSSSNAQGRFIAWHESLRR